MVNDTSSAIAEIESVFSVRRLGPVAGCLCHRGVLSASDRVQVRRKGAVIFDGKVRNLRIVKDDVSRIEAGERFGLLLEGFSAYAPGDIVVSVADPSEC